MAKPRSFVQRWIFEVRFEQRPSMLALGGELADRWIDDYPDLEVNLPTWRLKQQYAAVAFGINNAVLDIEGVNDITVVIKQAKKLVTDVFEVVAPKSLLRLGLRQILLSPGVDRRKALQDVLTRFGPGSDAWDTHSGRDRVSDIGITLEFRADKPFQGTLQFGPYVPGVNDVQNFVHSREPHLAAIKDGYIFNCDFGEENPDKELFDPDKLEAWLYNASTVSRERMEQIRRYIYPQGE